MKNIIIIALVIVLIITLAACNDDNGINDYQETRRTRNENVSQPESIVSSDIVSNLESKPVQERLPLIVKNNTVAGADGGIYYHYIYYLDNNNNVWEQFYEVEESSFFASYGNIHFNDEPKLIMSDVRSVQNFGIGVKNATFFIKTDNSLWGMGGNEHGILGNNGDYVYEPVKLLENVANIYFDGLVNSGAMQIIAITNDRELYRWGWWYGGKEDIIYNPEKILDDVVKYCTGGFAIKSDASLWAWKTLNSNFQVLNGIEVTDVPTKVMDNTLDIISVYRTSSTSYFYVNFILKKDGGIFRADCRSDYNRETGEYNYEEIEMVRILDNVKSFNVLSSGGLRLFAIKTDNSLWSCNINVVDRFLDRDMDTPLIVTDNIIDLYFSDYNMGMEPLLKLNNTWAWAFIGSQGRSENNFSLEVRIEPSFENMVNYFHSGFYGSAFINSEGALYYFNPDSIKINQIAENVKLSSEIVLF